MYICCQDFCTISEFGGNWYQEIPECQSYLSMQVSALRLVSHNSKVSYFSDWNIDRNSLRSLILYYDEYRIFLLAKAYGCRICCRNNFFRIPIRILVRYLLTLPNIFGHGNHILYLEKFSHPKILPSNDFIYKEKDNFN